MDMNMNKTTATATASVLLFLSIIMIGVGAAVNAKAEFIANTTSGGIKTSPTDPNYNIGQSPGLGFSIKYLKNMTIAESIDNSSTRISHYVNFTNPHMLQDYNNIHKLPHLIRETIVISPATGIFGLPTTLDDTVSQTMLTLANSNTITLISKEKGSLNNLPAYKIELNLWFKLPQSTTNVPLHTIAYITVKGGLLYVLSFATFDNPQTNFLSIQKTMIDSFKYN